VGEGEEKPTYDVKNHRNSNTVLIAIEVLAKRDYCLLKVGQAWSTRSPINDIMKLISCICNIYTHYMRVG